MNPQAQPSRASHPISPATIQAIGVCTGGGDCPGLNGVIRSVYQAAQNRYGWRVTALGHIQRGGSPSPFDRVLASRYGVAAVNLVARGEFGKMVALRGNETVAVDLSEATGKMKRVDPKGEKVCVARSLGISFGDS